MSGVLKASSSPLRMLCCDMHAKLALLLSPVGLLAAPFFFHGRLLPVACRYAKSLDASKFLRPSAPRVAGGGGACGQQGEPSVHLCEPLLPSCIRPGLPTAGAAPPTQPLVACRAFVAAAASRDRGAGGGRGKKAAGPSKADEIRARNLVSRRRLADLCTPPLLRAVWRAPDALPPDGLPRCRRRRRRRAAPQPTRAGVR